MEKESFEFLSFFIAELLNTDSLFTYNFLTRELHISRDTVSGIKQGKDMYMCSYLKVINYVMQTIGLKIYMPRLLKVLGQVLCNKCDLVVGVVPHGRGKDCAPEEWVVVMEWDASEGAEEK